MIKLERTPELLKLIDEAASDKQKIWNLIQQSYNAGFEEGKNATLDNIFSYTPED